MHVGPVFLSHATQDKEHVRTLLDALEARGVDAWLDERDLVTGQPVAESIVDGLQAASALVLCRSRNSVASEWVEKEVYYAAGRKIPILLVSLEELEGPRRRGAT